MLTMNTVDHYPVADPAAFSAILDLVRERTGADFSRYRLPTVARRIANRMISAGAGTLGAYLDLLRADEHEALHLLERVTIKVSRFYRNTATFDALRTQVIPELVRSRAGAPLRIWSAGCGCGEEPYTLAMLLAEACSPGFVVASDIDPHALRQAATARYSPAALVELPRELRERYLEADGEQFAVRSEIRERVHFARHDLLGSAPPPGDGARFDLVCCRNVLIYFQRPMQDIAFAALRRSVGSEGYLCLGEAEWPGPAIANTVSALRHDTHIYRAVSMTR